MPRVCFRAQRHGIDVQYVRLRSEPVPLPNATERALLENNEWVITENCRELIEGLPLLEQSKTEALSRERDDALRAARGGSLLHRVARAAKWFLIGAAAGAVAAKYAR